MKTNLYLLLILIAFKCSAQIAYEQHECSYLYENEDWDLNATYTSYLDNDSVILVWTNINYDNFSYEYRYNYNSNFLSRLSVYQSYNPVDTNWVLYRTIDYTYEDDLVVAIEEDYINTIADKKRVFGYNDLNQNDSILGFIRTDNINWDYDYYQKRTYDNELLASVTSINYIDSIGWENERKWEFSYDLGGNKISQLDYYWTNEWQLSQKQYWVYQNEKMVNHVKINGDGDTISIRGKKYYNDLVQVDSTIFFTDSLEFVNEKITYAYAGSQWEYKITARYDFNGNALVDQLKEENIIINNKVITVYTYQKENDHWVYQRKYDLFCGDNVGIKEGNASKMFIPNPLPNIWVLPEKCNIQLISLDGKILLDERKTDFVFFDTFKTGTYLLKINNQVFKVILLN